MTEDKPEDLDLCTKMHRGWIKEHAQEVFKMRGDTVFLWDYLPYTRVIRGK